MTDDVVVTSGGSELQRNSSGLQRRSSNLRRDSSSIRRPSFNRAASDNSPTRDFARAESGQGRGASPLPQPQEQDLQAAWELEVWKNAEEVSVDVAWQTIGVNGSELQRQIHTVMGFFTDTCSAYLAVYLLYIRCFCKQLIL